MNTRKPRGSSGRGAHQVGHQQPAFRQQQPSKPTQRGSLEKSASNSTEGIDGVYGNTSIVHAMTSLFGTVVQLTTREGITWEGVLRAFSPKCDIALDAATIIDPKSPSEGNNIGHLIGSLNVNEPLYPKKLLNIDDVVSVAVSNTDMDYASRGAFATDAELSKGKRNDSDEKHLIPWTPDDTDQDSGRLDSNTGSNGWTAEEMFARNEKLGVKSGFSDLDGTYTIALEKNEDTPESRERNRKAELLARDIEDNLNSRRRIEKENNDERDEEDQYSAVVRAPAQNDSNFQRHPKHLTNRSNSGDDMNWRSHGNRPQNLGQKQTAFSNKGNFNANNSPRDQRQDTRQAQQPHPRQMQQQLDQENRMRGDTLSKQRQQQQPLLQQQMPQQSIQHQPPPHRPSTGNVQQQPPVVSKEDATIKSIAPSMPSVPNYARAVAQPEDRPHNAWGQPNPVAPVVQQNRREPEQPKLPSPEVEKKTAASPSKVKTSPERSPQTDNRKQEEKKTESEPLNKKSPEREASTSSVDSIAKTSKLNPNAKEFTLNPTAKPFTPRSPAAPVVTPAANPAVVAYSPQQSPAINPVAIAMHPGQQHQQPQMHHHHQQHQQQPMIHMPHQPSMNRMPHQQVILPQMVSPNFILNNNPYQVVMNPQYQQQPPPPPVNQGHNPRPGGHNKYKGNNNNPNHNRNDQFNQNNVAAATGHPVLAAASIPYQQPGLNGTQLFHPMYSMHGFAPRMPGHIMGQVYDPSNIYMLNPQMSMVPQNLQQPNNGPQSNTSTPQSQTPTTPGLHGPSTPGPQGGHGMVGQPSQTPPAQTVMYTGQNLPPHSVSGAFNSQSMVLMQPHHQNPHGNVVSQGHAMPIPVSVLQSNPPLVMQQHYSQQNQPSR